MLRNSNSNRMWDPEGIRNIGMAPEGVFTFSGVEPEPVNYWDSEDNHFTDQVVGWNYPVVQDWTDSSTGEIFRQNEIEVVVDNPQKLDLAFGDKVQFQGLGGFYSRKSRRFRAHADSIEKVKK